MSLHTRKTHIAYNACQIIERIKLFRIKVLVKINCLRTMSY